MRLFPKIKFVKVLPLTTMEKILTDRQLLRGIFHGDFDGAYYIYVLKRKMSVVTLVHELSHWLIEVTFKKKSDKWHNMLDRYDMKFKKFCIKCTKHTKLYSLESLSKWEKHQIETRKERYADKTWMDIQF